MINRNQTGRVSLSLSLSIYVSIIEGNNSWLVWTVGRTRLNDDDPNDKMMMSGSSMSESYPAGRDPRTYHYHFVERVARGLEATTTLSRRDHTNEVNRKDGYFFHSKKHRSRQETIGGHC